MSFQKICQENSLMVELRGHTGCLYLFAAYFRYLDGERIWCGSESFNEHLDKVPICCRGTVRVTRLPALNFRHYARRLDLAEILSVETGIHACWYWAAAQL